MKEVNVYNLELPERDILEFFANDLKRNYGDKDIVDEMPTLVSLHIYEKRYVSYRDDTDDLSTDELLAIIDRYCEYKHGEVEAGIFIHKNDLEAFYSLIGRGIFQRRHYIPALERLAYNDTIDLESRWEPFLEIILNKVTVENCKKIRSKFNHPLKYKIENWLEEQRIVFPNINRWAIFFIGTIFGAIITALVSWVFRM